MIFKNEEFEFTKDNISIVDVANLMKSMGYIEHSFEKNSTFIKDGAMLTFYWPSRENTNIGFSHLWIDDTIAVSAVLREWEAHLKENPPSWWQIKINRFKNFKYVCIDWMFRF